MLLYALRPSTDITSIFSASFEIPLIPLARLSSLPATLSSFQTQTVRQQLQPAVLNGAISVLPYCSSNPPLPEHTRNVLSDVCRSFRGLVRSVATEDGRATLEDWLGNAVVVGDIVSFWSEEYFVE